MFTILGSSARITKTLGLYCPRHFFAWLLYETFLKFVHSAFALFKGKKSLEPQLFQNCLLQLILFIYSSITLRKRFMASAVKSKECVTFLSFISYRNFNHPDLQIWVSYPWKRNVFQVLIFTVTRGFTPIEVGLQVLFSWTWSEFHIFLDLFLCLQPWYKRPIH